MRHLRRKERSDARSHCKAARATSDRAGREPGWEEATQAYNLAVSQRPALVALPEDEQDVAEVVRYAAAHGLRVAPQRTGHGAEPLGPLDEAILLKTDRMQGVEIDAERRVARVRAGAKWETVVPAASDLGLAALHGSTPDACAVGYSLGGGVGWYARSLGLATNSVLVIDLVTADGELRRVDAEHDRELFWALRGGGGNFGVVTALEFRLYAIREVYGGVLFFPWERSSEVLHAWLDWTRDVPDEVTSVGRILQFPPIPLVPEELRGKQFAVVEAVCLGDPAESAELLRPLRALGPYDAGRQYFNFTTDRTDPARFYPPDVYARLRAVKARVDPGGLFLANHPI